MRHTTRGQSRRRPITTDSRRVRPLLEELEGRITPSTGSDLHPAPALTPHIASPNPGMDSATTVTIDPAGHVAVLWQDSPSSASGPLIYGEVNGSPVFTVSTAGTIVAASADTAGDVAVLWQSETFIGGYYLSFFSGTGAPLGGPVHLGTSGGFAMPAAGSVAGDSAGHFMAVWEQSDSSLRGNDGAHGQVFDAHGNPVSAAFAVNAGTNPLAVTVAADAQGGFVAVWQADTPVYGVPAGIYGQRYDAAGNAQGTAFQVNATGGQFLHVASDGAGNLVAVWAVYTSEVVGGFTVAAFAGIDGQRFSDKGVLNGGVFPVDTTPIPDGPAGLPGQPNWVVPTVAMDGGDYAEVVYATINSNAQRNSIFAQRYGPSGSPIGTLTRLNSSGDVGGPLGLPLSLGVPTVAADRGGDVAFGWTAAGNATVAVYSAAMTNQAPQALGPYAAVDQTAFARASYYERQSYFIDPDGDPLAYTASLADGSSLPGWLHIDDVGRLWGTPDTGAAGMTYQVKVTASDPWGASVSLVLPLTVRPDPSQPAGGPFDVASPTSGVQDEQPVTAVNAAGDAIVVWVSTNNGAQTLMGQVYDAQHHALGAAFQVSQLAGAAQAQVNSPTVTADAAGNFDVAWVQNATTASDGAIYLRHFNSRGVALDAAVEVVPTTATFNQFFAPSLAADAGGNLVLAWGAEFAAEVPNDFPVPSTFVRRFDPRGNALSAAVQVASNVGSCAIAVSPGGNIMVVWEVINQVPTPRFDEWALDDDSQVVAQLFDAHLNPLGGPVPVGLCTFQGQATVATDGLGNFDVAWVTDSVSRFGEEIAVERFNDLAKPIPNALGATGPMQVNTLTRGNQDDPQLATDGIGNLTVLWRSDEPDDSGVFAQRYGADGHQVGGEFRIAATTDPANSPAVAGNASGNLLTVWENDPSGNNGIAGQWYWPTPTVHVPPAQVTSPGTTLVFSTANGNAITLTGSDPTQLETLTLGTGSTATLTVTHATGLVSIHGNGTASVTLTGTTSMLNAALQGLSYHATAATSSAHVQVTLAANGDMTVTGSVPITVYANLPPKVTMPAGAVSVTAGSTLDFSTGQGDAITLADPDAGNSLETLTLWVTSGTLRVASTAGLKAIQGNGTGLLRLTGTLSALNSALNGVVYTPTAVNDSVVLFNAYLVDSASAMGWASTVLAIGGAPV